jgi:hypothetical protein
MSWPLRFAAFFTHSAFVQIVFLRLINVALFAAGLWVYRRLFETMGFRKHLVHLGLLAVVLTPAIAPLAGVVNYDNAVFLLSGLLLLQAVYLVKAKKPEFRSLAQFFILGLLGSVVKFEFVALFVPVAAYVLGVMLLRHKRATLSLLGSSLKKLSLPAKIVLISGLLISSGLFVERPVMNMLQYHEINPPCQQLMAKERCLKNYTQLRNITDLDNRPAAFQALSPISYFVHDWVPGMILTQIQLLPGKAPVHSLLLFYYAVFGLGTVFLLVYLRDLIRPNSNKFLLMVMIAYALLLLAYNYSAYRTYAEPVAITGRYLLPVLPIFLVLVLQSITKLFASHGRSLTLVAALALAVLVQSGGIATYLRTADTSLYWQSSPTQKLNAYLRDHQQQFAVGSAVETSDRHP